MRVEFYEVTVLIKNVCVKTLALITIIFFANEFTGIAVAQTAGDSASVYKLVEAYQNTFSTRDAAAVSEFFSEDADVMVGNLLEAKGRQAIRNFWNSYFAKQEPGRRAAFTVNSFRKITKDVAVINLGSVTGGWDSLGAELKSRKARGTWVVHQLDGKWLITSVCMMPTESDSIVLGASLETAESIRPHIRAFVDTFADAFNSHEPSRVSALFRKDADILVRNLPLIQGSQAIQDWWSAYFSKPRNYKAVFIIDTIRTISEGVIQVNVTASGAIPGTQDKLQPLRQTRAMWILSLGTEGWRIAALRVLPGKDDIIIRR